MPDKHLHIISFDIPYPPNYGGVIDVYYKIKALAEAGVKLHLHCIEYPGREPSEELNKHCVEVCYYQRKTGVLSAISLKPYIVASRRSKELLNKLLLDDYPILFEGLHSCYYLNHPRLKDRIKIYRESNIEHRYYFNLFKVDRKLYNKTFFILESLKLRAFQQSLKHANLILAVSQADTDYLKKHFPKKRAMHLPSFHANEDINIKPGKGEYVLYHGNIEVPENARAAEYLIKEVFNDLEIPLIIAGMKPPQQIKKLVESANNVKLIANPSDDEMFDLIKNAQINILVTFQATGLKLKLLNTLYNGRHCLVNDKMLSGTPLAELCNIANNAESLKTKIREIAGEVFDENHVTARAEKLNGLYCNKENARKLVGLIS